MVKVLVTGSRDWIDPHPIERELKKLPPGTIVVHGGARGVDTIAGFVAKKLGLKVREYQARWQEYGRTAGPIRNREMLQKEHPDSKGEFVSVAIAFHKDPNLGKGTKDMVELVREAQPTIEVRIFRR